MGTRTRPSSAPTSAARSRTSASDGFVAAREATTQLDVAVSPPGTPVYIDGRRMGAAPLTLRLQPGDYRIEADFGHRGRARAVHVSSPPELAAPVELAAAVVGEFLADAGPCVELGPDQRSAFARVVALVGVERLYGIRTEGSGERRWVVLDEVDAAGAVQRAARAQIKSGAPETEALGALADYAVTGNSASVVEVVKRSGAPGTGARLHGRVIGVPPPSGFTLQAVPAGGQWGQKDGVHIVGDRFARIDQPVGKSSLRVVTDDGRVGIAEVDTSAGGELEVDVRVEEACMASGRVFDANGQPVAGAHVSARKIPSLTWQSVDTLPKGRFALRELVRGDYQLSIDAGSRHLVRRFSVLQTCTLELGSLRLRDASLSAGPPSDAGVGGGGKGHP